MNFVHYGLLIIKIVGRQDVTEDAQEMRGFLFLNLSQMFYISINFVLLNPCSIIW